jgi:hypothetical protein
VVVHVFPYARILTRTHRKPLANKHEGNEKTHAPQHI